MLGHSVFEIIIDVIDLGGLDPTFSAKRIMICLHLEGPLDANTPASRILFSSERAFLVHM